MSEQIQLQKKNTNIYCFCEWFSEAGQIKVACSVEEYNPDTEDNTKISEKEYTLEEFANWIKKDWIVC